MIHTDPSGHQSKFICDKGRIVDEKEEFEKKLNPSILKCYQQKICTSKIFFFYFFFPIIFYFLFFLGAFTRKCFYPQFIYYCHDCNIEDQCGLCVTCATICHKNHNVTKTPLNKMSFVKLIF